MSFCYGEFKGLPATFYFQYDNGKYYNIIIKIKETEFFGENMSPLEIEQIYKEIDKNWVQPL